MNNIRIGLGILLCFGVISLNRKIIQYLLYLMLIHISLLQLVAYLN